MVLHNPGLYLPVAKARFWVPSGPARAGPEKIKAPATKRPRRHRPQMAGKDPALAFHDLLPLVGIASAGPTEQSP
jgi:hypothetical protein